MVNSERFSQLATVSKRIQILFLILFPVNAILGTILKTTWIFYIAPAIFCISWLLPGILLVLGFPSLAQAWLKGMVLYTPDKPWRELSTRQKLFVYFHSLMCFVAAAGLIIMFVNANVHLKP